MSGAPFRLLMIGNSHAASPRMAYAERPELWPGFAVDFLAVRGGNMVNLALRGTVLQPSDDATAQEMRLFNRVDRLDLSGYDGLALVGGWGWARMAELFDSHRSCDFPSIQRGEADGQLIGRALMEALLSIRLRRTFAARLLRQLQPLGKPVVMMPEPLPSADCGANPDTYGPYLRVAARGDAGFARSLFQRVSRGGLQGQAILPFWPEAAIVEDAFTAPDLMRDAPRLAVKPDARHGAADFAHGNAQYGALILDRITAAFAAR